jgi:hypothetical protein
MSSRYAPEPDKISSKVIRFFERKLSELDRDTDDIDKEQRRFRSVYSSVINHAMKVKSQTRRNAHKYALKTYVEQAPEWAGNLLRRSKLPTPTQEKI